MQTIKTTMGALGLGLLLCSVGACNKESNKESGVTAGGEKAKSSKSEKTEDYVKKEAEVIPQTPPLEPPKAAPSKHVVVNEYIVCVESCAGKSTDDRPTCHKNCAASVTAGTGDPAASACPRGCTEQYGSCLMPCEEKNADDAATCRKQCQQLVDKCVDGCTM